MTGLFSESSLRGQGLCEPKQSDLRNEIASCLAMTIFHMSIIGSLTGNLNAKALIEHEVGLDYKSLLALKFSHFQKSAYGHLKVLPSTNLLLRALN